MAPCGVFSPRTISPRIPLIPNKSVVVRSYGVKGRSWRIVAAAPNEVASMALAGGSLQRGLPGGAWHRPVQAVPGFSTHSSRSSHAHAGGTLVSRAIRPGHLHDQDPLEEHQSKQIALLAMVPIGLMSLKWAVSIGPTALVVPAVLLAVPIAGTGLRQLLAEGFCMFMNCFSWMHHHQAPHHGSGRGLEPVPVKARHSPHHASSEHHHMARPQEHHYPALHGLNSNMGPVHLEPRSPPQSPKQLQQPAWPRSPPAPPHSHQQAMRGGGHAAPAGHPQQMPAANMHAPPYPGAPHHPAMPAPSVQLRSRSGSPEPAHQLTPGQPGVGPSPAGHVQHAPAAPPHPVLHPQEPLDMGSMDWPVNEEPAAPEHGQHHGPFPQQPLPQHQPVRTAHVTHAVPQTNGPHHSHHHAPVAGHYFGQPAHPGRHMGGSDMHVAHSSPAAAGQPMGAGPYPMRASPLPSVARPF